MANMKKRMTRRKFVAAGIGTLTSPALLDLAQAPQIQTKPSSKPVVVAAANGNKSKDADGLTCVARAFKMITEGADVLDAVIAGEHCRAGSGRHQRRLWRVAERGWRGATRRFGDAWAAQTGRRGGV